MKIDTTLGIALGGIALGGIALGSIALGAIALGVIAVVVRWQPVGCVRGPLGLDLTV
jgi:hypothetical protein